ncbi:MAG: hypothetical protein RSD14_04315 [Clostridia bacterium]
MNIIVSKIPIISKNQNLYNGCTSDGTLLYLSQLNSNEVHIFNNAYCYEFKKDVDTSYTNIANNDKDNSIFLSKSDNSLVAFNKTFNKHKIVQIANLDMYKEKITSISYYSKENTLYVVNTASIISTQLDTMQTDIITKSIQKVNEKGDNTLKFSAVFNYKDCIYIAYIKENQSFLAKLDDENNILQEYFIDTDCYIHNIFESNGVLKLFVTRNINYIYETCLISNNFSNYYPNKPNNRSNLLNFNKMCNFCNNCNCCKCNGCECEESNQKDFDNCCSFNKENKCNLECDCECNCECECECRPSKECDFCKNLANIIESIALEETGISHILNAEGEKIQKAVLTCKNISELLKINESVNQTISNISMLEQILLAKLEAASKFVKKNFCHCAKKESNIDDCDSNILDYDNHDN